MSRWTTVEALDTHGEQVRQEYMDWVEDGKHVYVVTYPRGDGSTEVLLWRTFEGFVGCIARLRHYNAGLPVEAHYLLLWD